LEVPLHGSIFGEDGMNGVRGKLVTKQGAILTNALMSGIAAGIGSGVAQASQSVSTSPLGSVSTSPTDTAGILKQGVGTGVGKALDRLSQYYIQLAERTFPVIEVQALREVDVVITQGVQLDPAIAAGPSTGLRRDAVDRTSLMRAAQGDLTDE
jgi:conjugal transfer pilus assembly protein TraB